MGLFEKDYLIRLLEQLTQRMAAISTAIRDGEPKDALASIAEAQQTLAGPLGSSLSRLDPASVVSLLGAEKAQTHAKLLRLEVKARDALGEGATARSIEGRAAAIERASGGRGGQSS